MDPQLALNELIEALAYGPNANAVAKMGELLVWLLAGGAVPETRPDTRDMLSNRIAALVDDLEVNGEWR